MSDMLIPLIMSAVVGLIAFFVIPKLSAGGSANRTKKILSRIHTETEASVEEMAHRQQTALKKSMDQDSFGDAIRSIPLLGSAYSLYIQGSANASTKGFIILWLGVSMVAGLLLFKMKLKMIGFMLGPVVALLLLRWFFKRKATKRRELFINMFPDAMDMIVRSVRSGHPLNSALRMISDNMADPVAGEFRQLVDEIAYGRTLQQALDGLCQRIPEPDVKFFAVVLYVQQESGGNLGEVLSNLSGILRKRKQMRLKIKALTAEGRMTAIILGSLPVAVLGVLHLISPDYLIPLFERPVGNFILFLAASMVVGAFLIVNKMVQIDI